MRYAYTNATFQNIFLVDTGSDDIVISDYDAKRLRLNFNLLGGTKPLTGIGGQIQAYSVESNILFQDGHQYYGYRKTLFIAHQNTNMKWSILGQDILSHWDIRINPMKAVLELTPVSWDFTIP